MLPGVAMVAVAGIQAMVRATLERLDHWAQLKHRSFQAIQSNTDRLIQGLAERRFQRHRALVAARSLDLMLFRLRSQVEHLLRLPTALATPAQPAQPILDQAVVVEVEAKYLPQSAAVAVLLVSMVKWPSGLSLSQRLTNKPG